MNSVWVCLIPCLFWFACFLHYSLCGFAAGNGPSTDWSHIWAFEWKFDGFHTKSTHCCFGIRTGLYSKRSYIIMWVWWWVGNYCRIHGSPWWVSSKIKGNFCILKIWADLTVHLNNSTAGLRLPMAAFHEVCNDAVISMIRFYCIPTTNKDSGAYIFTCSQKVRTWEKSKFR